MVIMWDTKWILKTADDNHTCEPSKARVTAELLRHRMKNIVRANPTGTCGEAVRTVRIQAATEYGHEDDFYKHLVAELGTDAALEKQLLRVRHEVIGPTPRSRNSFNPDDFLNKIYGEKDGTIVLDSNKLGENWRDEIDKTNTNSNFNWTNMNENLRRIEEEFHNDDADNEATLEEGTLEEEPDDESNLDVLDKDLPKRVLIYTSLKLLKQLSRNKKSSVDGTFKSSSKLWTQQFIWMTKSKGFWMPCAFGWLPDKSEISYKIFFYLIQKKMEELGLNLLVKSVLCDFEINILKAIDVMLQAPVLGCFFHHKKCFQRRVDKKGFKTRYENDDYFHEFVNQVCGIAHLPIADIENGLTHIEQKFIFDDESANVFKSDFIKYIKDFWINGCIPPRVWNVFGRPDDLTNNNQEGFNSKFNKELKETHPSPGILLCNIRGQIKLSEEKIIKQIAAVKKPAQRKTYRDLAKARITLKKNYLEDRENDDSEAIPNFLATIGHNVAKSVMQGRTDNYEETRRDSFVNENDDLDTSNWIATNNEDSVLEELNNPDTYENRQIGVRPPKPWNKKKCSSCKIGFNSRSNPIKCDGCDSFTHRKQACIKEGSNKAQFYCKICIPSTAVEKRNENPSESQSHIRKVENGFKCEKCGLVAKTKYSIRRHMERKHSGIDIQQPMETSEPDELVNLCNNASKVSEEKSDEKVSCVNDVLDAINLAEYKAIFEAEKIDLDMLLDLRPDEFMEMVKDVGIVPWGHRRLLRKAIEDIKLGNLKNVENSSDEIITNLVCTVDPPPATTSDSITLVDSVDSSTFENYHQTSSSTTILDSFVSSKSCDFCAKAKQHKCRLCGIPVCNLKCSEQDPNSDNEQHRIHKQGDERCVKIYQNEIFTCPKCEEVFIDVHYFNEHMEMKHDNDKSFPSLSLASDGSLSSIHETCGQCGKLFENELDVKNHEERVHMYGELFQLYPCEECGFRAADIKELREHTDESHQKGEDISMESLGITQLPIVSKRRKQNFRDLQIDVDGQIAVEDDIANDADFTTAREDHLLLDSDEDLSDPEITIGELVAVKETRKRKVESKKEPSKRKKVEVIKEKVSKNNLQCNLCNTMFSRKDNLARHMRNKH